MGKKAAVAEERLYTWEEVSWMTGLTIHELLELFGADADKGVVYESLPPGLNSKLLEELAQESYSQSPLH